MSEWSELIAGAIGGGLVLAVQAMTNRFTYRRDSNKIFEWLIAESAKPKNFESRSTRAIAKAVSLEPSRVAEVCYRDVRIDPALGGREDLWKLSGRG